MEKIVHPINGAETQKQIEIPGEHVPLLVNSLLAEMLFGVSRRLNPQSNVFEWGGTDSEGKDVGWHDTPPFDFAMDDEVALELTTKICRDQGLVLDLQMDPSGGWAAKFGRPTPGSEDTADMVGRPVRTNKLSMSLSLLVCSTIPGASMLAQHQTLFPGSYLVLQS